MNPLTYFFLFFIFSLFLLGMIAFLAYIIPMLFGAPYIVTSKEKTKRILELASLSEKDVLYDLGSGDGRIVIEAAQKYGVRAIGIELNPILVFLSRRKIKKLGLEDRAKINWGNIFRKDLSGATVIVSYLLQITNDIIENKLLSSLRPGTKIVSETFKFKNIPLVKTHPEDSYLKLYKIS